MAKQVFFSFHYDDVKTFRANVVRNHGFTKENGQEAGFFDASIWEDAKLHGSDSVKRLINSNLDGTTATCVLIGTNTWNRRWVRVRNIKKVMIEEIHFLAFISTAYPIKIDRLFCRGKIRLIF